MSASQTDNGGEGFGGSGDENIYSAYSLKVPRALTEVYFCTCIHTSGVAVR